jgi:hypothetical protein
MELRRCRRAISAHIEQVADCDSNLFIAENIIGEVLGNVHRYAPGPFCAEVHWLNGSPRFSVHDGGPCFDPAGVSCPRPEDSTAENGRGLAIIKSVGGKIEIERGNHGGCRVSVERGFPI